MLFAPQNRTFSEPFLFYRRSRDAAKNEGVNGIRKWLKTNDIEKVQFTKCLKPENSQKPCEGEREENDQLSMVTANEKNMSLNECLLFFERGAWKESFLRTLNVADQKRLIPVLMTSVFRTHTATKSLMRERKQEDNDMTPEQMTVHSHLV